MVLNLNYGLCWWFFWHCSHVLIWKTSPKIQLRWILSDPCNAIQCQWGPSSAKAKLCEQFNSPTICTLSIETLFICWSVFFLAVFSYYLTHIFSQFFFSPEILLLNSKDVWIFQIQVEYLGSILKRVSFSTDLSLQRGLRWRRHWCSTSPVPGWNMCDIWHVTYVTRVKCVQMVDNNVRWTDHGAVNIEPPVAAKVLLVVEGSVWAELPQNRLVRLTTSKISQNFINSNMNGGIYWVYDDSLIIKGSLPIRRCADKTSTLY